MVFFQGDYWRWSPFLRTSSRSSQQDARWGLVSVTIMSPSDCRFSTHTVRGTQTTAVDVLWVRATLTANILVFHSIWVINDLCDHRQLTHQHRYRRSTVEDTRSSRCCLGKEKNKIKRSRNDDPINPRLHWALIMDPYLWGCRGEGLLVPCWGAQLWSEAVVDNRRAEPPVI